MDSFDDKSRRPTSFLKPGASEDGSSEGFEAFRIVEEIDYTDEEFIKEKLRRETQFKLSSGSAENDIENDGDYDQPSDALVSKWGDSDYVPATQRRKPTEVYEETSMFVAETQAGAPVMYEETSPVPREKSPKEANKDASTFIKKDLVSEDDYADLNSGANNYGSPNERNVQSSPYDKLSDKDDTQKSGYDQLSAERRKSSMYANIDDDTQGDEALKEQGTRRSSIISAKFSMSNNAPKYIPPPAFDIEEEKADEGFEQLSNLDAILNTDKDSGIEASSQSSSKKSKFNRGTSIKKSVKKTLTEVLEMSEENPTWDSERGRRILRRLYIRGCIPILLVLFIIGVPIGIASYYFFANEVTLDLRVNSFLVPHHPATLIRDGVHSTIPHCMGVDKCVESKCRVDDDDDDDRKRRANQPQVDILRFSKEKFSVNASLSLVSWMRPRLKHSSLESREVHFWHATPENHTYDRRRASKKRRTVTECSTSSSVAFRLDVVYEALGGDSNMFTSERLKEMRDSEARIARFAFERTGSWPQDECFSTITRYLYDDAHGSTDVPLKTQDEITVAMNYGASDPSTQIPGKPAPLGSEFYTYLGSNQRSPTNEDPYWFSTYVRSQLFIQETLTDPSIEKWVDFLEGESPEGVRLVYVQSDIFTYQILEMLKSDIMWAAYALAFVALYMLFHTGSLFLTFAGILNIILAFPIAYWIYREICLIPHLPILTPVTLFVVIGIAVDDVFVFVDMFKQAHPSLNIEGRLLRTMVTASRSTLFTTVTSAAAFAANTLSEIPALSNFGALTALVIACNYFVLLVLIPNVLCFWWRFIYPGERYISQLFWSCCPNMKNKNHKRESTEPAFAPDNGLYEDPDYAVPEDVSEEVKAFHRRNKEKLKTTRLRAVEEPVPDVEKGLAEEEDRMTWLQKGLSVLADFVVKKRRYVLAGYVLLLILFVVFMAQLEPADKPPSFVPDGSNAARAEALESEFADFSGQSGSQDLPEIVGDWESKIPDDIEESVAEEELEQLPTVYCVEQSAFFECDSGFKKTTNSNIRCSDVLCNKQECCEQDFRCSSVTSAFCAASGKLLASAPDSIECVGECTTNECCDDMTCSEADLDTLCTSGHRPVSSPAIFTCAGLTCNLNECCIQNPTCSESSLQCSNGYSLGDNLNGGPCESQFCNENECCVENARCDTYFFGCPFGTISLGFAQLCSSPTCQESDCCASWTCRQQSTDTGLAVCAPGTHQISGSDLDRGCSSKPCDAETCCDPNPSCADSPQVTCGSKKQLITGSLASSTICAAESCTSNECCVDNPTCESSGLSWATLCSAESLVVTSNLQNVCEDTTCVTSDCCVDYTCSVAVQGGFTCSAGTHLQDDLSTVCASNPCSNNECCENNPTCGENDRCGAGQHQDPSVASTICGSDTCTLDECPCLANPTCSGFASCTPGVNYLRGNAAAFTCSEASCTVAECCLDNPTCASVSSNICGSLEKIISSPGSQTCATSTCTQGECCESLTCSDADCGASMEIYLPNASDTCTQNPCPKDYCCVTKSPVTCAMTQADYPSFCGAGFRFSDSTLNSNCPSSPCLTSDCCEVSSNPTCDTFSCGGSKYLIADASSTTCSTASCTSAECCEDNPTCSSDPVTCVANEISVANPGSIQCSSSSCTQIECCRAMTCQVWSSELSRTCPAQMSFRDSLSSIACASTECTLNECCEPNPTCNDASSSNPSLCGSDVFDDNLVNANPPIICASSACVFDDCCVDTTNSEIQIIGDCSSLNSTQIEDLIHELKQQIIEDQGGAITESDIVLEICGVEMRHRYRRQNTIPVVIKTVTSNVDPSVVQGIQNDYDNHVVDIVNITENGDVVLKEDTELRATTVTSTRTSLTTTVIETTSGIALTYPPVDVSEIDNSPNTISKVLFGLKYPFVNRSLAGLDFIPETSDYKPVFDLKFFTTANDKVALAETICPRIAARDDLVLPGQYYVCTNYTGVEIALKYSSCDAQSGETPVYISFPFKTQFRSQQSSAEIKKIYDEWNKFFDELRDEFPQFENMQHHNDAFYQAVNETIAINGAIWGIATAFLLCFVAVTLFKANLRLMSITMTVILTNVITVLGLFSMLGYKLGAIEAVSLSILVGTCVDYVIHMMEGYLEADPDHAAGSREEALRALMQVKTDLSAREWRMKTAIVTVGVPVVSSAITTGGSAIFLTFASLLIFSRFGVIVVINTTVSIFLTLTLLPPLLAEFGPLTYKGSLKQTMKGFIGLAIFFSLLALILYICVQAGATINGADGEPLFK
eukprot:m.136049 g.136049  ORF g.136049 m.136049 type:complete len:2274 (-) comp14722_c0_seq4:389-7210(-)